MNTRYSYSVFHRSSKFFGYVISVISFFIAIFALVDFVKGDSIPLLKFIFNFLGYSVLVPLAFVYVDFLETDIYVDENGLELRSPLKIFHIKWVDIVEIRRASLFGLPMSNSPSIVITRSNLPLFHYLYGIVYARVYKPSFFFSSLIANSSDLRKLIIDNIKRNRITNQPKLRTKRN